MSWNPATIEQRTGRVDRIGSKVERERLNSGACDAPTLEIGVPYLAATYDERMFEELYKRAQLDLGKEEGLADVVPLPDDMVESLRVDLAVWRSKS